MSLDRWGRLLADLVDGVGLSRSIVLGSRLLSRDDSSVACGMEELRKGATTLEKLYRCF